MKNTKPTRRKRPPKAGTLVGTRFQNGELQLLDDWINEHLREHAEQLTRPEAIRRILAMTLGKTKRK